MDIVKGTVTAVGIQKIISMIINVTAPNYVTIVMLLVK